MGSLKVSLPTLMTLIGVPSTLSAVLFLSSSLASELVITSNMKKVVKDINVKDFIVCFWNNKKEILVSCSWHQTTKQLFLFSHKMNPKFSWFFAFLPGSLGKSIYKFVASRQKFRSDFHFSRKIFLKNSENNNFPCC